MRVWGQSLESGSEFEHRVPQPTEPRRSKFKVYNQLAACVLVGNEATHTQNVQQDLKASADPE